MPDLTLSTRLRAIQDELSATNNELTVILDDANHIGLAPFRIAGIQAAINDNQHAWDELNAVATALEVTSPNHKL